MTTKQKKEKQTKLITELYDKLSKEDFEKLLEITKLESEIFYDKIKEVHNLK